LSEPIAVQSGNGNGIFSRGAGETVLVLESDRGRLLRNEEILAALGYEPVGFVAPANADRGIPWRRARFDAALICHQPGTTAGSMSRRRCIAWRRPCRLFWRRHRARPRPTDIGGFRHIRSGPAIRSLLRNYRGC